ncbi:MAG: hypothetical protein ACRDMA_17440 [Solirubrobacterales bacterium]
MLNLGSKPRPAGLSLALGVDEEVHRCARVRSRAVRGAAQVANMRERGELDVLTMREVASRVS